MEKPYPISESAAPSKPSFVRRDSSTKLEYATFEGNKWINSEEVQAVKYDPKEPALAIFSRWRGTVLPLVANSQMFQLLMLIHFFFLFINFFVVPLQPMDSEVIVGLPASMLIFLVVFYNGNCYTRYFELWHMTCHVCAIVHAWVQQTSFILDDMSQNDKKARMDKMKMSVNKAAWRASRRMLSAMYLLFMALDTDAQEDDRDEWGRTISLPNPAAGDGIDDDDYQFLVNKELLTATEVADMKKFHGLKCLLPMKWALYELRDLCAPENRMVNQARNYESLQDIAMDFNKHAILMVTQMQQPVPFVYFHVLKLMMVLINGLVSYELINMATSLDSGPVAAFLVSTTIYIIVASMLVGLNAVGSTMADPFGNDDTDFDTQKICSDSYNNAIAYLAAKYPQDLRESNIRSPLPEEKITV